MLLFATINANCRDNGPMTKSGFAFTAIICCDASTMRIDELRILPWGAKAATELRSRRDEMMANIFPVVVFGDGLIGLVTSKHQCNQWLHNPNLKEHRNACSFAIPDCSENDNGIRTFQLLFLILYRIFIYWTWRRIPKDAQKEISPRGFGVLGCFFIFFWFFPLFARA